VDPDTRLFYRYYLDGRNYIRVETLENEASLKAEIEARNREILFKIRKLLVLNEFSWNFKEAEEY